MNLLSTKFWWAVAWFGLPKSKLNIAEVLGYVHTGLVPNRSDPILERTTSVHMGPLCLNARPHSASLLWSGTGSKWAKQLIQSAKHVQTKILKWCWSLNCPACTKRNWSRCLHSDRATWDRNSSKTWPAFLEVQKSDLIGNGTVSRSCVNKTLIHHDFWIGNIWNWSRVNKALQQTIFVHLYINSAWCVRTYMNTEQGISHQWSGLSME